jgi:hypothetical protein
MIYKVTFLDNDRIQVRSPDNKSQQKIHNYFGTYDKRYYRREIAHFIKNHFDEVDNRKDGRKFLKPALHWNSQLDIRRSDFT